VIAVGAQFLRYVALTFGFIGILRAYTGAFRGAGQTLVAAAITITFLGVIRLPVAAALAFGVGPLTLNLGSVAVDVPALVASIGPPGIWWGFVVSNVVGGAIAYAWFRRGNWREGDVRGRPGTGPDTDAVETTGDD
jgi:Na+-driven multidrug efflux pump